MTRATVSTLLGLALLGQWQPLAAQDASASPRSGFWLSLGLGQGSAGVECLDCPVAIEDRENAISGYFRIGGSPSPHFLVGIEGTGWMKNEGGVEQRIAALSLVGLLYPSRTGGFFVKAGFGGLRAVIENDVLVLVGEGLAAQLGLGWDISLGESVALTPYVNAIASRETTSTLNDATVPYELNPNILQFGLALTVR